MKLNKVIMLAGVSALSVGVATSAFAQSTASTEAETVVVTGSRAVGNVNKEYGGKTKVVIDQNLISQANPGNTIIDALNVVPGLNFTNTDAYGSSGGNLRMRGLDGSRISLTVDGVQLNDTGNYAIYTNQQLEPELICQASVNTGATDVDSMTASATGGTINLKTCKPAEKLGGVFKVTVGSENYQNEFLRFDTGHLVSENGPTAFLAVTNQFYDTWTREVGPGGTLSKVQYNARIYQNLGNGSFVSLTGHFNVNRNRFYFSNAKSVIYPTTPSATNGYDYNSAGITNINPSNTGKINANFKWVFNDKLTLYIDPAYQYVMANGGGNPINLAENSALLCGRFVGTAGCGVDLNRDGVINSTTTRIYAPSNTNTNRFTVTSSLVYRFNADHSLRFNASFDRGNHRQTGEGSFLSAGGAVLDVFSAKNDRAIGIYSQDGALYQRRNRHSFANVDNYSIEYRGALSENLSVVAGLRSQKMERKINQYCYTVADGSGTFLCTTQTIATTTATATPGVSVVTLNGQGATRYVTPFKATYSFDKVLPNLDVTYRLGTGHQVYANYAQSMSSPRTDSIYNVYVNSSNLLQAAFPRPETSTNKEIGYRYTSARLYATLALYTANDKGRIVNTFDEATGTFLDRNIGDVDRKGFETQVSWKISKSLATNFGYTLTDTKVLSNLVVGRTATNAPITIATKGKEVVETPRTTINFGANWDATSNFHLSTQAKYVGKRYSTDMNDDFSPAYTIWNASLRYDIRGIFAGVKDGTYLQINFVNLTDKKALTNISSTNNALPVTTSAGTTKSASAPRFNVLQPRAVTIAIRTAF